MSHLSPKDVVPRLRSDLSTSPPPIGTGAEVIRVEPIGDGEPMAMHGFEFSIARMLDGKRTVQDVIRNCERLGLPVDLPALEGFLRQLQAHGLIARGSVDQDPSEKRIRTQWSNSARELYCEALRSARLGDYAAAERRAEEVLFIAPQTDEARRLLELLEESPLPAPEAFQQLLKDVEDGWRTEALYDEPEVEVEEPSRSWRPLIIAGFAVAIAAGLLFVPLPRLISASAQLTPNAQNSVVTSREGLVQTVAVKDGDAVKAGAELFVWDDDDLQIRLADARAALEEARRPMREQLAGDPVYQPLIASLHDAERELARAQTALLEGQKDAAGRKPDDVAQHLETQFARADTKVRALRDSLDAALSPDDEDSQRVDSTLAYDVKQLENQLAERTVRAPVPGVVRELNVAPGQWVADHQEVAQVDDLERLKVVAVVLPSFAKTVHPGDPVTIRLGQSKFKTQIDAVTDYQIVATVPNLGGLQPGPVLADLELKPASIFDRLR